MITRHSVKLSHHTTTSANNTAVKNTFHFFCFIRFQKKRLKGCIILSVLMLPVGGL